MNFQQATISTNLIEYAPPGMQSESQNSKNKNFDRNEQINLQLCYIQMSIFLMPTWVFTDAVKQTLK